LYAFFITTYQSPHIATVSQFKEFAMGKAVSMQWKYLPSHSLKKFRSKPSAWKVRLIILFTISGPLMLAYKDPDIINAQLYSGTLWDVCTTIKRKHPGMLMSGVVVLHDSACPHVAHTVQDMLYFICWRMSDHCPYST
jgi:hypothetical protein